MRRDVGQGVPRGLLILLLEVLLVELCEEFLLLALLLFFELGRALVLTLELLHDDFWS